MINWGRNVPSGTLGWADNFHMRVAVAECRLRTPCRTRRCGCGTLATWRAALSATKLRAASRESVKRREPQIDFSYRVTHPVANLGWVDLDLGSTNIRRKTQIKGSALGFLEQAREINYKHYSWNHKK